jgi:hypothetical protein
LCAAAPRRSPFVRRTVERALDGTQQLRERDRFLDEIHGAETRCFDGRVHGAVARHHDDGSGRSAFRPFAQKRDSVRIRHPDVEQDEIEVLSLTGAARFLRVRSRRDVVALFAQDLVDERPNVGFVIDN